MGLAKIYDVDPSVNARATNLSARGFVGTGNDVLIGGIIGCGPPEACNAFSVGRSAHR
jgi:hypothetical protein